MKSNFFVNILFLVLLNLIIKPFWIFGIDRTIQNTVGNDSYGIYFALFGLSYLLNSLLDLGLTNYNSWSTARNPTFLATHILKLARIKLGLGSLYFIATLLTGWILGYRSQAFHLLFILSISQFLLSSSHFLRSSIAGLQLFWIDSILSVIDKIILIVLCGTLLWGDFGPFQIEWLAYAYLIAYAVTTCIAGIIVVFNYRKLLQSPLEKVNTSTRTLLQNSIPFALIILFMSLYHRMDAIMIERLLPNGNEQAGLYAQSYRILDMINNFVHLFTAILFPLFARALFQKTSIVSIATGTLKTLLLPTLVLLGIGVVYAPIIIDTLYTSSAHHSPSVLTVLLLSYPFLIGSTLFGTILTANGSLRIMIRITGFSFLVNTLLNFILIQQMGIIGAAIASLLAQAIVAILTFTHTQNHIAATFSKKWLSRFGIALGLTFGLGKILQLTTWPIALQWSLIGTLIFIFLIALRLITINELRSLSKSFRR